MNEDFNIVSLHVIINPMSMQAFTHWQKNLHALISAANGFECLEFLSPPTEADAKWRCVQRFKDHTSALQWIENEVYRGLLRDLREMASDNCLSEILTSDNDYSAATEVFIARVQSGKVDAYREWIAKIHQVEMQFPGFRGVHVQNSGGTDGSHWITLLQFDSQRHLEGWLESPERKRLLDESFPLLDHLENHRVISPYSGWFNSVGQRTESPELWKQAMVILLVLFPIVMLEFKFLNPITAHWELAVATFAANALSVALLSWPLLPVAIWLLRWWLEPKSQTRWQTDLLGVFLLLSFYCLEIFLFWDFLN